MAVTLWKLATNVEYRTLSELFGLGRSTVGEIVIETCDAIATHLLPQYVFIPQGDKLRENVEGFETYWGFPQAVGAIDGSHIPIIRPNESASDYYNRKGYYSVIMKPWLISVACLWTCTLVGQEMYTMHESLPIHPYIGGAWNALYFLTGRDAYQE